MQRVDLVVTAILHWNALHSMMMRTFTEKLVRTKLAARELSFLMSWRGRKRRTSFIAALNISCGGCIGGTSLKFRVTPRRELSWGVDGWMLALASAIERAFCIACSSCEADFSPPIQVLQRFAPRGTKHTLALRSGVMSGAETDYRVILLAWCYL
jgi:hypothetical protein